MKCYLKEELFVREKLASFSEFASWGVYKSPVNRPVMGGKS